ncbi:cAMP-binding domain of CRP or a regulatory subunit of cAMP-dependent protein kinases [Tenacibaculum sp. MAR_2009_124]|uniref:Crp/Fnr family transcriptional regulator n=1 Tax=Tenacibaculum sp. MAR_2009_124 TaxID=1250059 RepID=UPI000894FE2F|nr:Crp/Fnr family transcriptional regulator [Tenacibaculum sp. MAR_2009_124]SEB82510.1 cAMP-binding domain of CRP or a regulatory subunit of cAMP-dependent protein kinases [Tenacibaculum sp. MAR_2009_124]
MDKLTTYINKYISLDQDELNEILPFFERKVFSKNKFLIKKEQVVTHYYFIASGGVMIYDIVDDIQYTRYFAFENEFIADITKIKSKQRSTSFIKTIEETEVFTISYEDMEHLYDKLPKWQKFGRLIWEDAFTSVLYGIHNFQSLTAKERYLDLLNRSDLIFRVPLKDLSVFLGITPQSLSRIRKEISTDKTSAKN